MIGCNGKHSGKIEREGEPTIYQVPQDDAEMEDSIQIAKQTINLFDSAFKSANPEYKNFALKCRFETPTGNEHIWLTQIAIDTSGYFGVISNVPNSIQSIKVGDRVHIDTNKITDWMYLENLHLRGGYTIRLLRNRLSEKEKQQFDTESGFVVED